MNILIVAPNASSKFGGEAFIPLKYFELLKQRSGITVHLVVHARNEDDLKRLFPDHQDSIHYINDTAVHRWLWKLSTRMGAVLGDAVIGPLLDIINGFEQRWVVQKIVRSIPTDVIHQPIPVSPKAPSALFGIGRPVIIGPMNGGMTYPPGYDEMSGTVAKAIVHVSRLVSVCLNWMIPGKHLAHTLLVANKRTEIALPFPKHRRVVELVENGVDLSVWQPRPSSERRTPQKGRLTLAFVGRLIQLKAVDITLEAIKLARGMGSDINLVIIGDGDARPHLEAAASRLKLNDHIEFLGYLPQTECARRLQEADALILNSVRECGGAVVLEAMSLGLPVIASDWGGPADYIDPTSGILVSPVPRTSFAQRLAEQIHSLAHDPLRQIRLGQKAQQKVRDEFDWEKKVDRMIELYRIALESRQ